MKVRKNMTNVFSYRCCLYKKRKKTVLLLNNSAVAVIFFELGCHKKNENCGKRPYIYDVHMEWRWEILKVVMCLWILLLIFADGGGGRVMKMFSYLSAKHILFYLLIFDFPFILTEVAPFFIKGTSVVFKASNLFQIQ